MKFPYPIYFVYKNKKNISTDKLVEIDPNLNPNIFISGSDCWILQTFIFLKRKGYENVYLVPNMIQKKICIIHYWDLAIKDRSFRSFVVAIQADTPLSPLANIRVVQNRLRVKSIFDFYITHWPQPGLIPRDIKRGSQIKNIAYVGHPDYLAADFKSNYFKKRLADIGVTLLIKDSDWNDYENIDLILAVRDITAYDISGKPPSKLINAWKAGCPALMGPDPAYQQIRKNDMDYIEVSSSDEVYDNIVKLIKNPEYYNIMLKNCIDRSCEYTNDKIVRQWEELFYGLVPYEYEKYIDRTKGLKNILHLINFLYKSIKHKYERKLFIRLIKKLN